MSDDKKPFILRPGSWLGEGKITIKGSDETIPFYTRWNVPTLYEQHCPIPLIACTQEVEMQGEKELVVNKIEFTEVTPENFHVQLSNDLVGTVIGTGVLDDRKVAWEFRNHPSFEGFELYEQQENGDWQFHAEYLSADYRSIIDGRIWLKTN